MWQEGCHNMVAAAAQAHDSLGFLPYLRTLTLGSFQPPPFYLETIAPMCVLEVFWPLEGLFFIVLVWSLKIKLPAKCFGEEIKCRSSKVTSFMDHCEYIALTLASSLLDLAFGPFLVISLEFR